MNEHVKHLRCIEAYLGRDCIPMPPEIEAIGRHAGRAAGEIERLERELREWKHRAIGGTCRVLFEKSCDCALCERDALAAAMPAECDQLATIVAHLPKCWRLKDGELVQDVPMYPGMMVHVVRHGLASALEICGVGKAYVEGMSSAPYDDFECYCNAEAATRKLQRGSYVRGDETGEMED